MNKSTYYSTLLQRPTTHITTTCTSSMQSGAVTTSSSTSADLCGRAKVNILVLQPILSIVHSIPIQRFIIAHRDSKCLSQPMAHSGNRHAKKKKNKPVISDDSPPRTMAFQLGSTEKDSVVSTESPFCTFPVIATGGFSRRCQPYRCERARPSSFRIAPTFVVSRTYLTDSDRTRCDI